MAAICLGGDELHNFICLIDILLNLASIWLLTWKRDYLQHKALCANQLPNQMFPFL